MHTLVPPQPSLLQFSRIHSPVSVWRSVPHQDGSIMRLGTSSDSSLCPQNAAGTSYPMCFINVHLSTLKPEKLLEPLLNYPGSSRTGSSFPFPTRTCYKWTPVGTQYRAWISQTNGLPQDEGGVIGAPECDHK